MDFCAVLFAVLIAVAIVTPVGHGLWLLIAAVGRAIVGDGSRRPRADAPTECPGCGRFNAPWRERCPSCGLDRDGVVGRELADMDAAYRQVQRFADAGVLDRTFQEKLAVVIVERKRRLLGQPEPRPVAEPVPVSVPAGVPQPIPAAPLLFATRTVEIKDAQPSLRRESVPPVDRRDPAPINPEPEDIPEVILVEEPAAILANAAAFETVPLVAVVTPVAVAPSPPESVPDVVEERPPVAVAAPPPRPPRRPLTEMLAAFMEERNILWGELLGGLLIVGCSIALVISLWSQVEKIPYFPFVLFGTITASLFGAGLYTFHHWKLESSSRGLLVIATLLVPLNFLVMAGLHREATGGDRLIEFLVGGAFLALFVGLMASAGRVLLPQWPWLLVVGVLGPSVCQLLAALPDTREPLRLELFMLVAVLPALCHGASVGGALRHVARAEALDSVQGRALLRFLGLTSFALAVALGFLASRSPDLLEALHRLAILAALAGMPILACGRLVERRLADAAESEALRTTATAVALSGLFAMLLAVVLAWPEPPAVILVCAFNFIVLTGIAFRWQLPLAHAVALPSLALGFLTAFHSLAGNIHDGPDPLQLLGVMASSSSGTALAILVVALGLAATFLAPLGLRAHAAAYAVASGVTALASLAIVSWHGFDEPLRAAILYGLYGAGGLVLNATWRRSLFSFANLGLLLGATLWGLGWMYPQRLPPWSAVLATEALLLSVLHLWGRRREGASWLAEPLGQFAVLTGMLSVTLRAWIDWSAIGSLQLEQPALHGWTMASLAAVAFLLALAYRQQALTWIGSILALTGLVYALAWNATDVYFERLGLIQALLAHASLAGLATVALGMIRNRHAESPTESSSAHAIFAPPLLSSALITSLLSVPFFLYPRPEQLTVLSLSAGWLAALWLLLSCRERWRDLFAGFQAALIVAVVYGVGAWLHASPTVLEMRPISLWEPRSLQMYGIGLTTLGLAWLAARLIVARISPTWAMLADSRPLIDGVALPAVVIGQLALAVWSLCPALIEEIAPLGLLAQIGAAPRLNALAFGVPAWTLLGFLAVAVMAALWRRPAAALPGLILVAVTVPVLLAGHAGPQHAATATLCWGLANCFLVCSALTWLRRLLRHTAVPLGVPLGAEGSLAPWVRATLLVIAVAPVLLLTIARVLVGFSGAAVLQPLPGSLFAGMSDLVMLGVPPLLVALALVGHALRERSAGYAFAAGLIVDLVVMCGHALHVLTTAGHLLIADAVRVGQLGTITASLWAVAWLTTRRWLNTWRDDSLQPGRRLLMSAQVGLILLGNAILLVGGAYAIAADFPPVSANLTRLAYTAAPWAAEAGSLLGWLSLALAVVAVAYSRRREEAPATTAVGWLGLAVAMLVACSIERWTAPGWSYRSLMLGCALAALGAVIVAARQLGGRRDVSEGTPAERGEPVLSGVVVAGLLAVLLGLKAAIWYNDHLWAAGAILVASTAGAAVAVWQRREGWAFVAGLGLNLAASLVVWHFHVGQSAIAWWHLILQANCAAAGATALLWLGARRRFYGDLELKLRTAPLLAVQVVLGLLGNTPTLGLALFILSLAPNPGTWMLSWLAALGEAGGWLALLLPSIAALWYTAQATPRSRLPLGVMLSLAVGVLAACTACAWDTGNWLAFHLLTTAWCMVGLLTLSLGLVRVAVRLGETASSSPTGEDGQQPAPAWLLRLIGFPEAQIQRWVSVIGWLVVLLALRGTGSVVGGPAWSPAAALAVAVMAIGLALWTRKARYVYWSGVLFNLVANLFLATRPAPTLADFVAVNVLGLAFGSAFWSAFELSLQLSALALNVRGRSLPFNQLAAVLALILQTYLFIATMIVAPAEFSFWAPNVLTWAALALTAVAFLLGLWDATAPTSPFGLYLIGLQGVGFLLLGPEGSRSISISAAALALAGYTLFVSIAALTVARLDLARLVHLPGWAQETRSGWLAPAQLAVALAVLGLSLWIVLDRPELGQRLTAPAALVLLLPAGLVLARYLSGSGGDNVRHATLVTGVLALTELSWALLPTDMAVPWLHRNILFLTTVVVMTVVYQAARRRLPADWAEAVRHLEPLLITTAAVLLLTVLGQEAAAFDVHGQRSPVARWAIVLVALEMVGMIALGLRCALQPASDPLQLPERRRTIYVYGAEVGLALLFVHLKITIPLPMNQYWPFILMAIAFGGVGLSELFQRRGLSVLAEPLQRTGLFLPVLPLLAMWLAPSASALLPTAQHHMPAAEPLLQTLSKVPHEFDRYAVLWLLTGLLYSLVALSRKSLGFAIAAGVMANFALWSMWRHTGLGFLVHPQLWLIPLALIVLLAEHLHRERLQPAQSLALRYMGLGLIYLSSTADMFIAGLGHSLWLPVVLMVLSVAGVLLGILLRVRAYLFLGVGFLFLVIFSMIWHAAVDHAQTWVWWASGIVLGVAILTLFAIVEKRRNDVRVVIEQLKHWR